jgi:SAM-dependent methyltransferase
MADKKQRGCPACQSLKKTELGEKNGFLMLGCKNCRSIYSSYLPAGEESKDYDDYYTEANLMLPDFIEKRNEEIIKDFEPYFSSGRLLDIGFGSAIMMRVAQAKGWRVSGVEVSKTAVEYAEKCGFEVFHGELQEAKYPDGFFDVITASEIIEHCPQPEILLDEVIRILRPGGLFWATTPSAGSLSFKLTGLDWTIICPPEHLQLFSKKAIRLIMKKAGFSQVKIQTSGFNPFEVINTFRSRLGAGSRKKEEIFNRVGAGYALNESLTKSPVRQKIKNLLNGTLDFCGVGDSLKIKAVK